MKCSTGPRRALSGARQPRPSPYLRGASLTYNQGQLFSLHYVGAGKYTTLTQKTEGTFDAAGFFKGKCTYSNNNVYEGEIQGGLKHGMGRLMNHQGRASWTVR